MKRNLLKFLMLVGLITCQINAFGWKATVKVVANPSQGGKVYARYDQDGVEKYTENEASYSKTLGDIGFYIKAVANNGYKFISWSNNNTDYETQVIIKTNWRFQDQSETYTASFSIIPYTITLDPGEGSVESTTITYNVETETFALPVPSHSDASYHFAGWYEDPQFEGPAVNSIPKGTFGNKTYYAKYDQTLTPQITSSVERLEVGQAAEEVFNFINVSNPIPAATSDGTNFYYTIEHNVDQKISDEEHKTEVVGYDAEHNTLIAYNMGTATITFTQNANPPYEAASKSFQITVTKVTEGVTYVVDNAEGFSVNGVTGTSTSMNVNKHAKELSYTLEFGTGFSPSVVPQYLITGSDWKDLPNATATANGSYGPYDLSEIAADEIRFRNPGWQTAKFTNIKVTRLNYVKGKAGVIELLDNPEDRTTTLTVDWSISNGGDLKLLCEDKDFVLETTTIETKIDLEENKTTGVDGITPIKVTYVGKGTAEKSTRVTIYNDVHEVTVDILVKPLQTLGTVTCKDEDWFTFGASEKFQVPEGVEAYTGKLNGDKIELTSVACGSIVEGGQGIVFKGTEGETYSFLQRYADATVTETNVFKGSSEAVTPNFEATIDYYALGCSQNQSTGFYLLVSGMQIPAHRAYIEIAKQGEASAPARLSLGDEATGIQTLPEVNENRTSEIYNLSGQRIQRLQRGINIVNGKKVLVK